MPRTYKGVVGTFAYRRPRLRLVLANAHSILRRGVRMMLTEEPDLEVIGEASGASDAITLARCLQPDVLITDIFDDGKGVLAIAEMRRECPGARIVLMSTSKECEDAVLGAGADACIVIDAPIEVLLRAIRGETLDFETLATRHEAPDHAAADLAQVTAREREVLIGVAMGYSNKRIAGDLGRSVKTIENHRFKMMHKLGLRNTAAVTRYAMDHGLLDLDSTPPPLRPKN